MGRLLLAPALLAVGLSLLAQTSVSSPDKKADEHPASPCLVAGRVVTAAEGNPLKSARVALVPERSRSDTRIYAATSDGDGLFVLKDVAPGRYQFFATHTGFVDQQYQATGSDGGALLALKPGQKISDVLFRMTLAAVISGRVNNEDGEAMVRARVEALRRPTEEETEEENPFASRKQRLLPLASAQTDDRGQYRIFGLKPGDYYLRATDSFEPDNGMSIGQDYWVRQYLGTEYAPVYYPGVAQVGQAEALSLKPGSEVQADFSMQRVKVVDVAGHVVGPDGPAKDTWVMLEASGEDDFSSNRQDTTDEKGAFKFKGIPPGSYAIVVYQRREGIMTGQARQKIEVGGENIEALTIPLGGGATFRGRITTAGAGSVSWDRLGVNLSPVEEGEQLGGHGRVKQDGTFEITSVPDGNYAFYVWGLERDWYVKSARLGPDDILEKGLQVEKGASGGRIEVVVSSASAQVEGAVTDGDQAMIGAHVRIMPDPDTPYNRFRSRSATTDQTGHFLMAGLAPGKYRVSARSPASPGSIPLKSDPQIVTLSERDHTTVDLVIVKPQAE
ncbi:MAG TPA: carboxypeptidase regulatory-like domain-containing protein [Terriglobales bacterium]|nr:carboxypeptidase regulatory-like domain-containing protein [Terriglobales bacterium]